MKENALPRLFAALLLLVSLSMLVPLGMAVWRMLHDVPVTSASWAVPLVMLATGAALMYLTSRKVFGAQLFLVAMALWLLAAGYFFYTR